MKQPKSYLDEAFLKSPSARSVRILSEYLDPERRFEEQAVNRGIILFGSARLPADSKSCRDAADLAEKIAAWTTSLHGPADRYHVITGGGPGIMQAAHEGSARVDQSLNVGLNISLPHEEDANPWVDPDKSAIYHYFFMRKFWFLKLAEAAVIFPGGFGTMDELFELLTLTQTGKSASMPIILYDPEFWKDIINFEAFARRGLIDDKDLELFQYAETPDQAMDMLIAGLPPCS